jgi:hypothetical protein
MPRPTRTERTTGVGTSLENTTNNPKTRYSRWVDRVRLIGFRHAKKEADFLRKLHADYMAGSVRGRKPKRSNCSKLALLEMKSLSYEGVWIEIRVNNVARHRITLDPKSRSDRTAEQTARAATLGRLLIAYRVPVQPAKRKRVLSERPHGVRTSAPSRSPIPLEP